jgi:outer membrane protein
VRASKAQIAAADEAAASAGEQLRLAEGRYRAGLGSIIELGDAQVVLTNARAQGVQARYNLAAARAQLATAMGRT